jgi:hypothetical protein
MRKGLAGARAPTRRSERLAAWALRALLAGGLLLRLHGLDDAWLNPDEGVGFSLAAWPTWSAFWRELAENAHPPLYYALVRLWGRLALGPIVLRLPSLLFGCLAIHALFLLGRRLGGLRVGLVAAALAAASPGLVVHARLIRPYTLLVALLAYALVAWLRYLETRRGRDLALGAALLLLATLTHYSALILAGGLALVLAGLLARGALPRREAPRLAAALGVVPLGFGLLYALHVGPHLAHSRLREAAREQWVQFLPGDLAGLWSGLAGLSGYVFGPRLDALATLLFLLGVASLLRRRSPFSALALGAIGLSAALAWLGQYPFGSTRHVLYLAVVLVPCVAEALSRLLSARPPRAIAAALALAGLAALPGPLRSGLRVRPQPINLETATSWETAQGAARTLERARARRTLVFFDRQTYEVLMPLVYRERERARRAGSPPVERLPWGVSELLVADAYALSALPLLLESPAHVVGFQRHTARLFPDLGLERRSDGLHLYSGWGAYYRHEFGELNRLLGGPPPCFSSPRQEPGFGSVRVDFARCLHAGAPPGPEPSFEELAPPGQGR